MDENYIARQFKQADELYQAGKFSPSLDILRELNGIFPDERKLMFPMARCLNQLGQEGEALDLCNAILNKEDYKQARELRDILEEHQSGIRVDFESSFAEMESDPTALSSISPTSQQPAPQQLAPTPPPPTTQPQPQTEQKAVAEPFLETTEPWYIVVVGFLLAGLLGFGFLTTAVNGKDLVAFVPSTSAEILLAGVIDILVCTGPLYAMLYLVGLLRKEGTGANAMFACAGGLVISAISISIYLTAMPSWADDLVAILVCSIYYRLPMLGVLGYWTIAVWCKVALWSLLLTSFAQACLSLI